MQRTTNALYSAAFAAGVLTLTAASQAAPLTYQTEVLSNNPYVYYRFQANQNPLTNVVEEDATANNRDGIYRGAPTGNVTGVGLGSDSAVSFPGTSLAGLDYLKAGNPPSTPDLLGFGAEVPQSSYEFIFKSNATPAASQALFGVINADPDGAGPRTQNAGLQLELNTANLTNNFSTTTTRMWLRDEANNIIMANIAHGNLMDGAYHHFVVTVNLSEVLLGDRIKAYIDGSPVAANIITQGGTASDFQVWTRDPTIAARNVRGTVNEEANVTIDEAALYEGVLTAQDVADHYAVAGIPEPASLGLAGIAGLGLLTRRRRN